MLFDDRLATVLRLRADSPAMARIQYRQLVDLLGSSERGETAGKPSPTLDAAHARLVDLGQTIPAEARAAILRDPALRLSDPGLVALLAQGEPAVAEAAVRLARLDEGQWLDLAPALPLHARGAMRARRDLGPMVEARMAQLGIGERALPPGEAKAEAPRPASLPQPPAPPVGPQPALARPTGIGDLVRRIEAYRKARPQGAARLAVSSESPRLPLGDGHEDAGLPAIAAIDVLTDTTGRIVWAEAPFAPLLSGLALLGAEPGGPVEAAADLRLAFRRRQPLRGQAIAITGAPAVAGAWQLNASPRFATPGGQFTGY
ncbi:MAG TPA: sensor histidine kinase, partial [Novosphingobium sp.]|nr:sensor histidine kinase [Novosphingobium sp.]